MNQIQRVALWDARFEAAFRYRYFLALKDRFARRITVLGVAVAILSCGPLASFFWQVGIGNLLSGTTGAIAGLLGVYLGASGVTRTLATATRAATEWGNAARMLELLWTRCESGENVWAEYLALDESLTKVDAAAIEDLRRDTRLEAAAWSQSETVLAARQ